jgi:hypothetical protein
MKIQNLPIAYDDDIYVSYLEAVVDTMKVVKFSRAAGDGVRGRK